MIYIIDGMDCTGKSSLIRLLYSNIKSELPISVIHSSWPANLPTAEEQCKYQINYYTRLIDDLIKHQDDTLFILDRCWLMEPFYSKLYRNIDNTKEITELHNKFINNINPNNLRVFYITSPIDDILHRFQNRNEPLPTVDDLLHLQQGFINAYNNANMPYTTLTNTNNISLTSLTKKILHT